MRPASIAELDNAADRAGIHSSKPDDDLVTGLGEVDDLAGREAARSVSAAREE